VTNTILNYIGGDPWTHAGEWIQWDFEVPEDGYYNISIKARQMYQRGALSGRTVYIDGEVPFEDLETVTSASKAAYMARVKISEEELTELMDNETWITPKEAVKMGFATEIQEEKPDGKATQSAMGLIMDRLTQQEAPSDTIDVSVELDTQEVAKAIVEAMEASEAFRSAVGLGSAALPGEPDGAEPEENAPEDAWKEFWD
jgi:hypothetical protein